MSRQTARRRAAAVTLVALAACAPDAATGPGEGPRDARRPSEPVYDVLRVARTPVLFVHGWNSTASTWTTMLGRFRASGYADAELAAFSYDFSRSNAATAQLIAAKVDSIRAATGAARVAIVTHSMGALSARYYTRNLGGDARVESVVSLGGPNHGTSTALLCAQTSCAEMRPNSTFLQKLNATDETWGAPRYATWWSTCDQVILPQSSTPLTGAANTRTACLQHSQLQTDASVYAQVLAWVDVPPTPRLLASR